MIASILLFSIRFFLISPSWPPADKEPLAKIDYVNIVDINTIEDVEEIESDVLIAIAVYIGKTRLIDNIIIK